MAMNYAWQWWKIYQDTGEVKLIGNYTAIDLCTVGVVNAQDGNYDIEYTTERDVRYIWVGVRYHVRGMCCYTDINEMVNDMEKFDNVKF